MDLDKLLGAALGVSVVGVVFLISIRTSRVIARCADVHDVNAAIDRSYTWGFRRSLALVAFRMLVSSNETNGTELSPAEALTFLATDSARFDGGRGIMLISIGCAIVVLPAGLWALSDTPAAGAIILALTLYLLVFGWRNYRWSLSPEAQIGRTIRRSLRLETAQRLQVLQQLAREHVLRAQESRT